MDVIWPEARRIGRGTDWVNAHPICTLFLNKLTDLNRYAEFDVAYEAVEKLAQRDVEADQHELAECA